MESASLGLPSNEPGDILNVSHVLKFPNCIKKKEGGESRKKLEQTDQDQIPQPLKFLLMPVGFIQKLIKLSEKETPKTIWQQNLVVALLLFLLILRA